MRILDGVGEKLGRDQPGVKCVAWLDKAVVGTTDVKFIRPVAPSVPIISAISRRKFPRLTPSPLTASASDLWSFAVTSMRALISSSNWQTWSRVEGLAAFGNGVALQANGAAQAGEVVGDPMIGLGQSDVIMLDQNCHFRLPSIVNVRLVQPSIKKTIIRSMC